MSHSEAPEALLPRDAERSTLIIIPTVANPATLLPSFQRLLAHLDGEAVHIVVSINALKLEHAAESLQGCEELWSAYVGQLPKGSVLTLLDHTPGPAGFGGAINLGLRAAIHGEEIENVSWYQLPAEEVEGVSILDANPTVHGLPDLVILFNDDLHVSTGWLSGLLDAVASDTIHDPAEVPQGDKRPTRWMKDYLALAGKSKVGLVGPMSNCASGLQQISKPQIEHFERMGPDDYAAVWGRHHSGTVLAASFLSGFCLGLTADCLEALWGSSPEHGPYLMDERFRVAGFEDNDLCVRADLAGFKAIIAADTFVAHLGHQTFDSAFPEMQNGMKNRLLYYEKWRPLVEERASKPIVGLWRVKIEVPHDLMLWKGALCRSGELLDGAAVLLTNNPGEALQSEEAGMVGELDAEDRQLLQQLQASTSATARAGLVKVWVERCLKVGARHAGRPIPATHLIRVQTWPGGFNERNERNHVLAMAEQMGAGWGFSLDHDEYVEPRITRLHLERLFRHPDPMVSTWDVGFYTTWTPDLELYRLDQPWGDGGSMKGGMRGFRIFRLDAHNPKRILAGGANGLHCGNVPVGDQTTRRISGIRIRHHGYYRRQDRERKHARYVFQDPTPDPGLVGATSYAHLLNEERVQLSRFFGKTGIGLHILIYGKEDPEQVMRHLDLMHGLVDCAVLVWTDPESLEAGVPEPLVTFARAARVFQADSLHHPLEGDMARARNAGLNFLQERVDLYGLGWALFVDPDEHLPYLSYQMIRRMADANDCWGWLFPFDNPRPNGATYSESIRLSRLDPEQIMRMDGRVHEGFAKAIAEIKARGLGSILRFAPFKSTNGGMAVSPEAMQRKLDRYFSWTVDAVKEDPSRVIDWVTLGLYFVNEGAMSAASEAFARAVALAGDNFLPYREMGFHLLRQGTSFLKAAAERLGNHPSKGELERLVGDLESFGLAHPQIGQPGKMSDALGVALVQELDGNRVAVLAAGGEVEPLASLPFTLEGGVVIPLAPSEDDTAL